MTQKTFSRGDDEKIRRLLRSSLTVLTKFSHQEIRLNYGLLCNGRLVFLAVAINRYLYQRKYLLL